MSRWRYRSSVYRTLWIYLSSSCFYHRRGRRWVSVHHNTNTNRGIIYRHNWNFWYKLLTDLQMRKNCYLMYPLPFFYSLVTFLLHQYCLAFIYNDPAIIRMVETLYVSYCTQKLWCILGYINILFACACRCYYIKFRISCSGLVCVCFFLYTGGFGFWFLGRGANSLLGRKFCFLLMPLLSELSFQRTDDSLYINNTVYSFIWSMHVV